MRKGSKMSEDAKRKISASLAGNSYRRGIPHDAETKQRIAASVRQAYAEGRHAKCGLDHLIAYHEARKRSGIKIWNQNFERDAEIASVYARLLSYRKTGEVFNLTGAGIKAAVVRHEERTNG